MQKWQKLLNKSPVSAYQFQLPPLDGYFKDDAWPKDKPIIRGGSVIMSHIGEVIAGPLYNKEGLVCAEIDLNDILKARCDMDPTGHLRSKSAANLK